MAHDRISSDPAVMMGKPCIKGTRITVELILRKLGAGRSFADVLNGLPASYRGGLEGSAGIRRGLLSGLSEGSPFEHHPRTFVM